MQQKKYKVGSSSGQMDLDQQKDPNMMMAQPQMPQEGITIQDPYKQYEKQLFQQQSYNRLNNMNQAYLVPLKQESYSDMRMCEAGTTKLGIKSDIYTAYTLFEVDFGKVKCFQTGLKGKLYSQKDEQQSRQEDMYEVEYNRNCFGCKCASLPLFNIFGVINWCICTSINPSTAFLKKNGQILFQYQTKSSDTVLIKDSEGNIKYWLQYKLSCCSSAFPQLVLFDSSGKQEVQGVNMQAHSISQDFDTIQTLGAAIRFSPNMSEDEKAGIMFAIMRLI